MGLLPGVFGFVLMLLFDLNKIYRRLRGGSALFALGGALLAGSTLWCALGAEKPFGGRMLLALALCAACLGWLVYLLFFALPFSDTYAKNEGEEAVASGAYGRCRHPAFWPFLFFYLCLYLALGGDRLLKAAVLYPLCNFVYICLQDRLIFPRYIRGYDDYQTEVPFLIPRLKRR